MDPLRRPSTKLLLEPEDCSKVRSVIDPLMLSDEQMSRLMQTLQSEMWQGMSSDVNTRRQTALQMENTYVRSLVNGREEGDFLALDLGGTNFRVLLSRIRGGVCDSVSRNYNVPTDKLYGPAAGVFDHLAQSIFLFLQEETMLDRKLPLGFTFSFPMVQEGLKRGILVTWTKSFACPDGVGQDAVKMLEDAIARRGDISVDVVAVLNDTTGTLLAGSYLDHQCQIGLIMGTGCNAAYLEELSNVEKWTDPVDEPKQVVIDIEWGAFGDNGSLDFTKTEFDQVVDQHSNHIGSFTFEKLFAGHYVGDIVRLVLVKLCQLGLLFRGHCSEKLKEWGSVTAGHISDVERDTDEDTCNTHKLVGDLGLTDHCSDTDISIIRYLCTAVSIRGAQFISASIAVLLKHMKKPVMTVAIDGSLYKYHPYLHDMMMTWIKHLAPDTQCELILAENGSGRGAAFLAAVIDRMNREQGTTTGSGAE